ncbi:MAG: hypothetical protein ACT4NV_03960 [Rhodoferax sp.]
MGHENSRNAVQECGEKHSEVDSIKLKLLFIYLLITNKSQQALEMVGAAAPNGITAGGRWQVALKQKIAP